MKQPRSFLPHNSRPPAMPRPMSTRVQGGNHVSGKHHFSNLINMLANSRAQQMVKQQQAQPGTLTATPAPGSLSLGSMPPAAPTAVPSLTDPVAAVTTSQDQQDAQAKLKKLQGLNSPTDGGFTS